MPGRGRRNSTSSLVTFTGDADRATLSRAVSAGRLQRIARGMYLPAGDDPVASVARNWLLILAHEYPGALIADRSARAMRPLDGALYVVHDRRSRLHLPGLTIIPRSGPGHAAGDSLGPEGIWMSSVERGLLDNLAERTERTLDRESVEHWIAAIVAREGEDGIDRIRDQARAIAPAIGRREAMRRLDALISAALATGQVRGLKAREYVGRKHGMLVDDARVERFRALAAHLASEHPGVLRTPDPASSRTALLPFYESYFSNCIEGTTFTLDEAARIVLDRIIPERRPGDAHDVLGTHRLASDPVERIRRARTGAELGTLIREFHGILISCRQERDPGRYRDVSVGAGNTVFVHQDLVRGTLEVGFEAIAPLVDPFSRAVFLHLLLTEVHPFRDGNGRISRLAMNAELSAAGYGRIIIPTGFRDEYIGALKAASNHGRFEGLVSVLDFARRWTAQMDFTSRTTAEPMLRATNALAEATEIRDLNLKLLLPSRVTALDAGA